MQPQKIQLHWFLTLVRVYVALENTTSSISDSSKSLCSIMKSTPKYLYNLQNFKMSYNKNRLIHFVRFSHIHIYTFHFWCCISLHFVCTFHIISLNFVTCTFYMSSSAYQHITLNSSNILHHYTPYNNHGIILYFIVLIAQ